VPTLLLLIASWLPGGVKAKMYLQMSLIVSNYELMSLAVFWAKQNNVGVVARTLQLNMSMNFFD